MNIKKKDQEYWLQLPELEGGPNNRPLQAEILFGYYLQIFFSLSSLDKS